MLREIPVMVLLLILVSASAVGVVYGKYRSRMLFNEAQALERELETLEVEWEQLLIEEHAWADPSRIGRLARARLDMVVPKADEILYLAVP